MVQFIQPLICEISGNSSNEICSAEAADTCKIELDIS